MKKKFLDVAQNPFQKNEPTPGEAAIFGNGQPPTLDTGRKVARPVSIYDIYPSPTQPRRTMPSYIRAAWDGNPATLPNLFSVWEAAAGTEHPEGYKLIQAAWAGEEADRPDDLPPALSSLLAVMEIAASIRQMGLIYAPTALPIGNNKYQLETGERRWLAYHLLAAFEPENESWRKISLQSVDRLDVFRQAAENNQRANLTAIGRARQFALLLMELAAPPGLRRFEECENEQAFYAQAADLRVPSGTGEMLLNAMGMKHRAAFSRCRAILKLPNEWWLRGDDENMPEDRLLLYATTSAEVGAQAAKTPPPVVTGTSNEEIVASRNNLTASGGQAGSTGTPSIHPMDVYQKLHRTFVRRVVQEIVPNVGGDDRRRIAQFLRQLADQVEGQEG